MKKIILPLLMFYFNVVLFSQSQTEYFGWEGHYGPVYGVVYNNTGTMMISSGGDGTIRFWETSSKGLIKTVFSQNKNVTCLAGSPDGTRIADAGSEGVIEVWNLSSQTFLYKISFPDETFTSITFSSDGKKFATSGSKIRIFDVTSGAVLKTFSPGFTTCIRFMKDGSKIITGDSSGYVKYWDASSGELSKSFNAESLELFSLAISQDGNKLATGGAKRIKIWNAQSGSILKLLVVGHYDRITSMDFSLDGTKLVSCSDDTTVRLWDITQGELLHTFLDHTRPVKSVAFSPNGYEAVSGSLDGAMKFFDVPSNTVAYTLNGHTAVTTAISFSPDGYNLITGGYDSKLKLWDVGTGMILNTFTGLKDTISAVAVSPDGSRVCAGSYDNRIRVWRTQMGIVSLNFPAHNGNVLSVAYSKDGANILSSGEDSSAKIWYAQSGLLYKTFKGHIGAVNSAVYSPDNQKIATAGIDGYIKIWSIQTGEIIDSIQKYVRSIIYNSDGSRIISANNDNTINIWNTTTGTPITTFTGHTDKINSIAAFGPFIASASMDGTIKIWNMNTQKLNGTIIFEHGYPATLCFDKSGNNLGVSGWGYNNIRIYSISSLLDVNEERNELKTVLYQNYPNPFNPSTLIIYRISKPCNVSLKIYDILGKEIETLVSKSQPPGLYNIMWNANKVPSGIYFYKLRAGDYFEIKKLIKLK